MKLIILCFLLFSLIDAAFAEFMPNAFEAQFDQTSVSQISKKSEPKIKRKLIEIKYQFSGNILVKEEDTTIVCNPDKMWVYTAPFEGFEDSEKGELKVGDSSKNCFSKVFDSLKKGLKDNSLYQVKKLSDLKYDLIFTESVQKQLSSKKLELNFKSVNDLTMKNVSSFLIYNMKTEKPVEYETKSFKPLQKFPKGTFTFKAPKNTNTSSI